MFGFGRRGGSEGDGVLYGLLKDGGSHSASNEDWINPEFLYDGDWNSGTDGKDNAKGSYYFQYTKPNGALSDSKLSILPFIINESVAHPHKSFIIGLKPFFLLFKNGSNNCLLV